MAPVLDDLRATRWWHDDWVADVVRATPITSARGMRAVATKLYWAALADQEAQNTASSGEQRLAERELAAEPPPRARTRCGCSATRTTRLAARTSTPIATSPPRGSCAITASRGCRWRPTSRRCSSFRPRDGGDYLQRPRFLAISEFGPGPHPPRGRPLPGQPRPGAALTQRQGHRRPPRPAAASPAATTTTVGPASTCARTAARNSARSWLGSRTAHHRLHAAPRADLQRRGGTPPGGFELRRPTGSASTAHAPAS